MANKYIELNAKLEKVKEDSKILETQIYEALYEVLEKQNDLFVNLIGQNVTIENVNVKAAYIDKTKGEHYNIFINTHDDNRPMPFHFLFIEDMLYLYKKVCEVTNEEEDKLVLF